MNEVLEVYLWHQNMWDQAKVNSMGHGASFRSVGLCLFRRCRPCADERFVRGILTTVWCFTPIHLKHFNADLMAVNLSIARSIQNVIYTSTVYAYPVLIKFEERFQDEDFAIFYLKNSSRVSGVTATAFPSPSLWL